MTESEKLLAELKSLAPDEQIVLARERNCLVVRRILRFGSAEKAVTERIQMSILDASPSAVDKLAAIFAWQRQQLWWTTDKGE